MISDLDAALEEHRAAPWPRGVDRGEMYGDLSVVMVDADLYGFASRVAEGQSLPLKVRMRFEHDTDRLKASLPRFPAAGRPYFERLLGIAEVALRRLAT